MAALTSVSTASPTPIFCALLNSGLYCLGVVTRYDIDTVENSQVWYEVLMYDSLQSRTVLSAMVECARAVENDEKASMTVSLTRDLAEVILLYNSPIERPDIFSMFYHIPSAKSILNSTIGSWNDAYAAISVLTPINPARCVYLLLLTLKIHSE